MVRLIPTHTNDQYCSIPLAIGLFASITAIVALCANHARKHSRKQVINDTYVDDTIISSSGGKRFPPLPLRSTVRSTKQLITSISSKAMTMSPFSLFNKNGERRELVLGKVEKGGFKESGLWQKGILMGEKCQPPEFSGVIYYDYDGNRISQLPPRSPRASPLPTTFSFPVLIKDSI